MRKKINNNLRHFIERFQTFDMLNRVSANIMISRWGSPSTLLHSDLLNL